MLWKKPKPEPQKPARAPFDVKTLLETPMGFTAKIDGQLDIRFTETSRKRVSMFLMNNLCDRIGVFYFGPVCDDDNCDCQMQALQSAAKDGRAPFKTIEIVPVKIIEMETEDA